MPKNAEGASTTNSKMVSVDTVAILLMALGATTVTQKQLEMMSAMDGTRTAKSFSHQIHEITKKAKEFKARFDAGEEFTPVQPKKRGASQMSSPPSSKQTPAKKTKSPRKSPAKGKVKPEPELSPSPFGHNDSFHTAEGELNGYDDDNDGALDEA